MQQVFSYIFIGVLLFSCAQTKNRNIVRQSSSVNETSETFDILIMQEKQSFNIALLKLEHAHDKDILGKVILLEAGSLIYEYFDKNLSERQEFLPEFVRLLALATKKRVKVVFMCRHEGDEVTIKSLLADRALRQEDQLFIKANI